MTVPTEIDVWQGEIAELEVDAIIIPANETLFMTAPVARSVRLRAGEAVERAAVDQGPVSAGTAVVTGGGQLATPYVVHAVGIGLDLQPDAQRLAGALTAALDIAERLGLNRVALSSLGTERGVFTAEQAADILVTLVGERHAAGAWLPESVVLVATSAPDAAAYRAALEPLRVSGR